MALTRRSFLTSTAAVAVAMGAAPSLAGAHGGGWGWGGGWSGGATNRFGPLLAPDANGIMLPAGFQSRVIARALEVVPGTSHAWHYFPDGGACFPTRHGGWTYVSNSESVRADDGGVGAIDFDRSGRIVAARSILTGSARNCAGGPTPWGTWLTCEELPAGRVFECDPAGRSPGIERPALGRFSHEAAAVDAESRRVYLTEDTPDGRLYRFTADRRGDLRSGLLEAARVDNGRVTWLTIPDPSGATTPTRLQVPETTPFAGGEGIWWVDGAITFVTKRDHRVWRLDTRRNRIAVFYDALADPSVLGEPDNVTVTDRGDVYVTEDQSADQQVVLITRRGSALPIMQLVGQTGSELTGIAFTPRGDRMYISSQRGSDRATGLGITYEITGPFHATQSERFRGRGHGGFGWGFPGRGPFGPRPR